MVDQEDSGAPCYLLGVAPRFVTDRTGDFGTAGTPVMPFPVRRRG